MKTARTNPASNVSSYRSTSSARKHRPGSAPARVFGSSAIAIVIYSTWSRGGLQRQNDFVKKVADEIFRAARGRITEPAPPVGTIDLVEMLARRWDFEHHPETIVGPRARLTHLGAQIAAAAEGTSSAEPPGLRNCSKAGRLGLLRHWAAPHCLARRIRHGQNRYLPVADARVIAAATRRRFRRAAAALF